MPRVFPGGAARRNRTPDLLVTNQLLYLLSYGGIFSFTMYPMWAVTIVCYTPAWRSLRRYRSIIHLFIASHDDLRSTSGHITDLFSPAPVHRSHPLSL